MQHRENLRETVYVELVHSLFETIVPTLIMSLAFTLSAALIYARVGDATILVLGSVGVLASIVRVAVVLRCRRDAARSAGLAQAPDLAQAHRLERSFAASYLGFSICLGLFGGHVFLLPSPEAHMLTICLLVGYCAGVAAVVGLRPLIAIPAMVVAIGPAIVTAAFNHDEIYWAMSGSAAALLAGGAHSVLGRHRAALADIGKRITFASVARQDGLTALPNRLALREWFEENVAGGVPGRIVAVHYLDLDGFKPVNDKFGHPVGDDLLRAVASRLTHSVRSGDIAARLGGDEFAIVQRALGRIEEAELLAHRLSAAMKKPFRIDDHVIRISACIGTVTSDSENDDLEQLLGQADQAMYAAKRGGSIVTRRAQRKLAA